LFVAKYNWIARFGRGCWNRSDSCRTAARYWIVNAFFKHFQIFRCCVYASECFLSYVKLCYKQCYRICYQEQKSSEFVSRKLQIFKVTKLSTNNWLSKLKYLVVKTLTNNKNYSKWICLFKITSYLNKRLLFWCHTLLSIDKHLTQQF
jgi:hypothetical protein